MPHATSASVVDYHRDDAGVVERTQPVATILALRRFEGRTAGAATFDVDVFVSYDTYG